MAFLPDKKVIALDEMETNSVIGTHHVNSALTYVCQPNNTMLIYRYEECFKVFIHESFHNFGLDFTMHNNAKIHRELQEMFNINKNIDLAAYESYTEFRCYYRQHVHRQFMIVIQTIVYIEIMQV